MKLKLFSRSKITFSSLFVAIFLLSTCEKDELDQPDLYVLFQYEYVNYAWGFSHNGWFIDNKGNIKGYKLPEIWKGCDSLDYIAYDSLICNYNQTDTVLGQVDLETLFEKSAMIEKTLNGDLSEMDCHGADMGRLSFYCYYWDSVKKKYKRQFLSEEGDCEQYNTTSEAIDLTYYLKHIKDY